ncbi:MULTISPECIES: GTP 3',8-cyclase MoaA [Colwellia]|jgi:cyclic pyranopterin phosphate synthase|uniref:GTP 3',8-cyclase n=1 Tax=Colwellia psychrerythraea (strain 34H / ATCC BAA-681) TaxID=167879 RepID=Q47V92_COLP3|nr:MULTISPECIES: GTP 3',8-cyclase MoaA [Colwellia]AAZ25200.1 molybdenum cofactor biosynthesis protein A [Colwellia psychrerythraea 34H]PKH85755.1 GTP 3',8-cyclase MoaA [Colwellia sp. Bg11-28]
MLTDNFGRRFSYLRLSITDVCNFSCTYCLPDGYQCDQPRDFLSLCEIKRIAKAFAELGTEKIRITGGEPALRKDLPEIIRICKETAGIKKVAITSNGFKLPDHLPHWLDAGIDAINISIDSLDPRQFHAITGHDKLKTILTGIDMALADGRASVKVNTVLMRDHSGREIQSYLDWLKDTPITLRFIELMQTGDNKEFFDAQHVQGSRIKQNLILDGWLPVIQNKSAGPAQEFYHPDYQGKVGLIMPYSKDFCSSCNRLRISSSGKLHLCLFGEEGLSLREQLQSDDIEPLQAKILALLGDKKATHYLHEKLTGATKHLAMLGG